MGYIAGIGGANMDIHGKSDRQLIMRDSNPGSLHTSLGGVCRNICENLARLGETVRLITVVGDDVQGRGIIEGCEKAGIDMSATRVLRGERSSSYISIMDGDGDMLLAMSDMHIIKQLNAQLVDESRDLLCGADLVVLAGCLVVIPKIMVDAYPNRIINIHPALIPAFCGTGYYGLKVHEAALARGVKVTGATVHYVDSGMDTGPIILQGPHHGA